MHLKNSKHFFTLFLPNFVRVLRNPQNSSLVLSHLSAIIFYAPSYIEICTGHMFTDSTKTKFQITHYYIMIVTGGNCPSSCCNKNSRANYHQRINRDSIKELEKWVFSCFIYAAWKIKNTECFFWLRVSENPEIITGVNVAVDFLWFQHILKTDIFHLNF